MSQQGIFSIAPDSQNGASNGASSQQNGSPFASVAAIKADQNSPFASVASDSPFQQVAQSAPEGRNGIPQPRANGQLPASSVVTDTPTEQQPATDNAGGPFQMKGFPEQQGSQVMEAAPVAATTETSPFVASNNNGQHDYEAAKAGLEPQQDFAAVQPRYQVAQPSQLTEAMVQAAAPAQPLQASQPSPEPLQAAPAPAASQQPQPFSKPAPGNASAGFQQLELRAIFGVDHALTVDEIIQRARTLPGIRNVSLVGANESNALSNFRQALQGMGLGSSHEMKLSSGGGEVDFVSEGETTVAVLHEGSYGPGVEETLIIVAREIGKLS